MDYFFKTISLPFYCLKENAEWICAIALSFFAYMQYKTGVIQQQINLKQKNLILLEKRLNLKNKFEDYVDDKLKNSFELKLNIDVLKETFVNLINMADSAFILFDKDIYERIKNLAEEFEDFKTTLDYTICKRNKKDLGFYNVNDGTFEKDISVIYGKLKYNEATIINKMNAIMQKDKVTDAE